MEFKVGDKVIISSKVGKPVYGFDENNVYGKIGESEEKWSYPYAVEIKGVHSEGFYQFDEFTFGVDPEHFYIILATNEDIKVVVEENQKNYEAVHMALAKGERMGNILSKGQEEADRDL